MKKFYSSLSNISAQATVEYILFILIMLIACSGVLKIIIVAWQHKFEFISQMAGVFSAFFC
jgi:hypothetical protein